MSDADVTNRLIQASDEAVDILFSIMRSTTASEETKLEAARIVLVW
jgi:hypothetical protein